jgi:fido (protein-threonine AMPylation protein)
MKLEILDGLRNVLLSRGSFDTFPGPVWKEISSQNTYGSNAIEGNALTRDEVDRVVIHRERVKKPTKDLLETMQHASAFVRLVDRRSRPIDIVTIRNLHEEVFKGVLPDYGQWRRSDRVDTGLSFKPARSDRLGEEMTALIREYDRRDVASVDVFALGAWLHHDFESLHPFSDGNGRVGRLLLNLHFLKHNWPPVNVMPADKERYMEALLQGDRGELQPLTGYLMVMMGSSLLNFLSYVGTGQDELRPLVQFQDESVHSPKYLSLRAKEGDLPAVRRSNEWLTSKRALELYVLEREGSNGIT